ncbi:biotin/lipoyl-containing protein [Neorhizobium sp. JUb45]|uniref:acetyl-CoA carboxylase biotin carboxyl carrier protein n=1 Tax=unclassified Neorhizobium TaxID=2629175 RepID=UPI0010473CE6|nr:biotin/lipoyl-containing protein [Neorhizobium sp. JUb45]TCR00498.1 acetyl-CoA carboxylase biotin carboxyl carrier protein [Neorhizobium sp. JUb45]
MDLSKIETLIEFVGRSNVTELMVSEKDTTVRIFRDRISAAPEKVAASADAIENVALSSETANAANTVAAPIFGVLHVAPAPGDPPFVKVSDEVVEGQTLFIIEAMKVFNKIAAPRAGRITRLTDVNGVEVEAGDMLAEIV